MNIDGPDLDLRAMRLFLLLHAERHLTRAAHRAGLSQPALSRALARMREQLDDPLFVREGRGIVPTARADALVPRVEALLSAAEAVLRPTTFEPKTLSRRFVIGTHEFFDPHLMPRLAARLARVAPHVDVVTRPLDELDSGTLDLTVSIRKALPMSVIGRKLYDEHLHCALRKGHPAARRKLDLDTFCALPHLVVAPKGVPGGLVERALAAVGRERRIAMQVHSFGSAPAIVAESDLLLTAPRRVLEGAHAAHGLRLFPPPLELAPLSIWLAWSARDRDDPAHAWFRDLVAELASGWRRAR